MGDNRNAFSIRPERIGLDWEMQLQNVHAGYFAAGVAWIHKIPHETVPSNQKHPRTGAPLFTLAGRPPYDYHGFFLADTLRPGVAIAMEAKATRTETNRLPIIGRHADGSPGGGSGLLIHQLERLADAQRAGCLAAIVFSVGGRVLVCSRIIDALRMYEGGKRRSIPLTDEWFEQARWGRMGKTNHFGYDWIECCDLPERIGGRFSLGSGQ